MASTFRRKAKPAVGSDSSPSPADSKPKNDTATSSRLMGLAGTKPWTGGTILTSSGLRDLDAILGGGQPLGTCILLEEDRWTNSLALCLVRYWCAEAISQKQHLMIPTAEIDVDTVATAGHNLSVMNLEDDELNVSSNAIHPTDGASKQEILQFLQRLPRNLHWDKQQQQQQQQRASDTNTENNDGTKANSTLVNISAGKDSQLALEPLVEEEDDNEENDDNATVAEDGLKIAWQYRKDVQRKRLGHDVSLSTNRNNNTATDTIYCYSYDLSSRLSDQQQAAENWSISMEPISCSDSCDSHHHQTSLSSSQRRASGIRLFQRLIVQLRNCVAEHPRQLIRLLLHHRDMEPLSIALPLMLAQVRTHSWPVIILVSMQSWKATSISSTANDALTSLHRTCDVVLQAEGFAARSTFPPPPEFRHLHGLLYIRKVNTFTAATAIDGGHYADLTLSKRPPANLYGLKRDRRKLNIPMLHIPPEDHAGGGGSVGGGGVRSGAGRPAKTSATSSSGLGCASSGGSNSLLDF